MIKPGLPIRQMGQMSETALDEAKAYPAAEENKQKNAVTCFGHTVDWTSFTDLLKIAQDIENTRANFNLSTGYLYGLIYLAEMAEGVRQSESGGQLNIENALWNSRFSYRTWRMLERQRGISKDMKKQYQSELGDLLAGNIQKYGITFQIALFIHLYNHRK